ncbi:MAG: redoxin domain-containing protein, partial [Candidatus Saccharimonas sp.]|nr:redoxin domain-containing protein [Planctomycetaceae bacterium]
LKQLAIDYRERDVELIAISVSQLESDRLDKMKERAKDSQFPFPYLQDTTQAMGHRFGATVTPQVFVLNSDRRIAYMGAVDDQWKDAAQVETHYTRAAIDALLAGKQPEIRETRPVGCAIEYTDDPQQNKP